MLVLGILVFFIFIPIFFLSINKSFKSKFSEVNSVGFDLIYEFLIGLIYFLIIFIASFLNFTNNLFLLSLGILIYIIGVSFTYVGYYNFFKSKKSLIDYGLYKFSRNPTYLFTFLSILGIVIVSDSLELFLLLVIQIVLTHKIVLNEEKFLEKKFGKRYLLYKKEVRRYF